MGSSHSSNNAPPTVWTLDKRGRIVRSSGGVRHFDNSPVVKVERVQQGILRMAFKKILARCSFSPGWIRYERLMQSVSDLSAALFGASQQLELHMHSPVVPLGMEVDDTVTNSTSKRYDVFACLRFVGSTATGETDSMTQPDKKEAEGVVWTTKIQDWRRFDSRKIGVEAQLRVLEEAEKYLREREEQYQLKISKMMDLDDENEHEEVHAVQRRISRGQKIKV